jgi:uncharacterized protein DUF1194
MNRCHKKMAIAAAAMAAALCHEAWAARAAEPVAMELVLAIDTSASVDEREFALQVGGIAKAFRDPEVIAAIESLGSLGMAVTLVQWSAPESTDQVLPFSQVNDSRTAKAFGFLVSLTQRRSTTGTTAMAQAVQLSADLLDNNAFTGDRRVIDVSGDGRNNTPPDIEGIRDEVVHRGITINGLAILNDDPQLDAYYRNSLIGGKDAFVEVAQDYDGFAQAIRQKLIREIYPPLSENGQGRRQMAKARNCYWLASAP